MPETREDVSRGHASGTHGDLQILQQAVQAIARQARVVELLEKTVCRVGLTACEQLNLLCRAVRLRGGETGCGMGEHSTMSHPSLLSSLGCAAMTSCESIFYTD